eukprot:3547003-Rhodomonas_salina.1
MGLFAFDFAVVTRPNQTQFRTFLVHSVRRMSFFVFDFAASWHEAGKGCFRATRTETAKAKPRHNQVQKRTVLHLISARDLRNADVGARSDWAARGREGERERERRGACVVKLRALHTRAQY